MTEQLKPALRIFTLMVLLTGILYPFAVSGLGQILFAEKAAGSLLVVDGEIWGSELIGQPFTADRYFWSRPSATELFPYNAAASAGSNLAPTNSHLLQSVEQRVAVVQNAHREAGAVPVDLVTASGSGLDPHISPAAATYQVARVAAARGIDPAVVAGMVREYTEGRQLGILGEPRVNVLRLNLALDRLQFNK